MAILTYLFSLTDLMPQVKVQSVETVEGCTHEVSAVKMHMKNRLVSLNCVYPASITVFVIPLVIIVS